MKIKHFSGYGSVNATKISNIKINEKTKRLVIKVSGNHECGIYRNDYYDIYNWLVKRFAKDCTNYNCIYNMTIQFDYTNTDVETCIYTIEYIANKIN